MQLITMHLAVQKELWRLGTATCSLQMAVEPIWALYFPTPDGGEKPTRKSREGSPRQGHPDYTQHGPGEAKVSRGTLFSIEYVE